MKRREAKVTAAAEAAAKAKAEKQKAAPKAAAAQDHVAPRIGAHEVMASYDSQMAVVRERRLQALARKYPEVAKLIEAAKPAEIAVKPAEIPPVENPDEVPAV